MKATFRLTMLGAGAAGVLILAILLASAGQHAAPVRKVEPSVKTLAPGVLRKLTAPTSREVILESIKSLPRPSVPLARAAGTVSPPIKLQMRQGTGKTKPAATTSVVGAAQSAAMNAGYDKIDWKAGVFISPFTVPRYGLANWPVAMLTTHYVDSMKTQDPGLVVLDWAEGTYPSYTVYSAISAELELPEDSALYTIALKIVREDGLCSESWVRDRTKCGAVPVLVWFSGSPVPMTKLIDDSGIVGIVNIEAGPKKDGSSFGMRGYNAYIQVNLMNWPDSMNEPVPRLSPLVFAGIMITRLQ